MPGYMKPCRYCGELVPPDSNSCPICGKWNPVDEIRCPKCRSPIKEGWKGCAHCGQSLTVSCPACGKDTFFGDHCQQCGARLMVKCQQRKCGFEQPPLGPICSKCGKPISGGKK
ncbi:MAG: zinc ribbon domain-containing protein [Methanomassiliicoccus sp.]|nr:zinc ribbon domain-containing protein [Methanomassiliicoccus sp.]